MKESYHQNGIFSSSSDSRLSLRGRLTANWRGLNARLIADDFLDGNTLAHPLKWILALQLLQLSWRVLIQELVDAEVASTNLDQDLAALDLDAHSLLTKLVDTLRLAHKHDLKFAALGIVVDVIAQSFVHSIRLNRDVNCNAGLKINNVLLKVLDLLEELKTSLIRLEALVLDLLNIVRSFLELDLQLSLFRVDLLILALKLFVLLHNYINVRL